MPETVMDQIVATLRRNANELYPQHGELKNVRVVGHTPKPDHFIYDVVMDFAENSQRVAAKVYRASKGGIQGAQALAAVESSNLNRAYEVAVEKGLSGIPRPLGDFTEQGAVVSEKISGLPLQSIIMKAALLPGYSEQGLIESSAAKAGAWLRAFHKATAAPVETFDSAGLMSELEGLCESCKGEGLDDAACKVILGGAKQVVTKTKKGIAASAVLCDFTPLNVIVSDETVGVSDYAKMRQRGASYTDVAQFLACVEALEKYPFCNRHLTGAVQDAFLEAYGLPESDQAIVRVLKMKALLSMFAQGRNVKESAIRKKVMWATVMKRFIGQAARRSLAPAA